MNTIECIEIFVEVAKGLSFSKAAERLGISRSAVTKKVAWLEQAFETQLLHRNTKRVSLTESGEILLQNADTLSKAVNDLKGLVSSPVQRPTGRIRVGAPPSFGAMHLAPAIQEFVEAYPAVQVSMLLDDGRSDLIAENLDLSLRIAPRLKDSNQVAYKIAVVPQVLVATQEYLNRYGWPSQPDDLESHNCLIHSLKAPTARWELLDGKGAISAVQVGGTVNSNLGESLLHLACRHHGISMHPLYMVEAFIRRNSLRVVLPDYRCPDLDIYAVVQSKRYLPYKIRLFVEQLQARFRNMEWAAIAP